MDRDIYNSITVKAEKETWRTTPSIRLNFYKVSDFPVSWATVYPNDGAYLELSCGYFWLGHAIEWIVNNYPNADIRLNEQCR